MAELFEFRPVYTYVEELAAPVEESVFESGDTQRRLPYPADKIMHEFILDFVVNDAEARDIRQFFARHGRFTEFWYKNWEYFSITGEALGTGNGVQVQFGFRYYPLKSGTVVVYLGGVAQGSGFTVDYSGGTVTFVSPPGVGVVVSVDYEFYHVAVFDMDRIETRWIMVDRYSLQLQIREKAPSRY